MLVNIKPHNQCLFLRTDNPLEVSVLERPIFGGVIMDVDKYTNQKPIVKSGKIGFKSYLEEHAKRAKDIYELSKKYGKHCSIGVIGEDMNHLVASLDCLTALIRRTRKEDISFGLPITQLHNHTLESFSKNKLFSYLDIPAMNISDCLNEYQLQMASSFGVDYVTFDFDKASRHLIKRGLHRRADKDKPILDKITSLVLTSLERGRNYIDRNNLPTKSLLVNY